MRKYVWKKEDEYSDPLGLNNLMDVADNKIQAGEGPFVITQDGEQITRELPRPDALDRLQQAISSREVGSTFRTRKGNGNIVFVCRAIRIDIERDTTNGNGNCDRYYNWVWDNFASYDPRFAGAYVCKFVLGKDYRSQHSYGNAIDFFFRTMSFQDEVAKASVKEANSLDISLLISRDRDWSPAGLWTPYGGEYHWHLHVQFRPEYSGDCGVRG